MNNLALFLSSKGDYAAAEPLSRRALSASERVLGTEHPDTLVSVNNLALLLSSKEDFAGAEPLYRRALAARERVFGAQNSDTLQSVKNLAGMLLRKGDYVNAEPFLRRAVEGLLEILCGIGHPHPQLELFFHNYAGCLEEIGCSRQKKSKIDCVTCPLPADQRIPLSTEQRTPLDLRGLALDCYRLGDYAQALALLRRVLEKGFEIPGTHCHVARVALMTDDLPGASEHAEQAWERRAEGPPYVTSRILWLELAVAMLNGDTSSVAPLLGRLKTALQAPGGIMEWTMDPVLAHLQPKLTGEDHALLTALVAAMISPDKLADLDRFPHGGMRRRKIFRAGVGSSAMTTPSYSSVLRSERHCELLVRNSDAMEINEELCSDAS